MDAKSISGGDPAQSPVLSLQDVCFGAPDGSGGIREIVKHANLELAPGRLVVMTGPNGGGKSTLAKLVAGIEKPASGRIFLEGEDITSKTVTERARLGIGFAFQQPVRFKGLRVFDLLRFAAGRPLAACEACEYLAAVGLCAQSYVNREVNSSLSGGELKRIEIATVLAKAPKVSIFDEPEAGIDLWSFRNLIEVFEHMRETAKGGAMLVISHQERILEAADDIVVLRDGEVAMFGPKEKVLPTLAGTNLARPECSMNGHGKDCAR